MRTLHLLHAMPRCGSTMLSMHLASMPDVVLLSEIHNSHLVSHPCDQALHWHGLVSAAEASAWKREHSCAMTLAMLCDRAAEAGKKLVVREWSFGDFCRPELRSSLYPTWGSTIACDARAYFTKTLRASLVRDPVDQWLSFQKFNRRTKGKRPDDLASCMATYRAFAEMASTTTIFRFEELTQEPEATLRRICETLQVPYSNVGDAWKTCTKVTGDPELVKTYEKVEVLPPRPVDAATLAELRSCDDYLATCRMLGYPPR
jgi:hypothetical protein